MATVFRVVSVVLPLLVALRADLPAQGPRATQLLRARPQTARAGAHSIVQLLARPEAFDGKRVRVTGFIHFEFEGNGIYLHREDHEKRLYANGPWVDLSPRFKPEASCQDRF